VGRLPRPTSSRILTVEAVGDLTCAECGRDPRDDENAACSYRKTKNLGLALVAGVAIASTE